MPDYPGADRIREQIRDAFGASGYSEHIVRNAADYLAMIQSDADQRLEAARKELKLAEDRRTAVRAIVASCTGDLATKRTDDALKAQARESLAYQSQTIVAATGAKPVDNLACPAKNVHDAHTWRFREETQGHRCPGWALPEMPIQLCPDTVVHAEHTWDTYNGSPHKMEHNAQCPGIAVADRVKDRACGNAESHPGHRWTVPSSEEIVYCWGIPS